jgi:hypothetical protein
MQKTLALLHRALRTDVRQLRTHLFRCGLVGVICALLMDAQQNTWSGAPGLVFFSELQFWNFWFITFAGATFFATPISEEKEELTLGLLRIAGIGPLTLLLGKWLPRVIGALLLLSVQFPFTLLAITLGGVLLDQALAAYCALAAHLLLVSAIGLLASVVAARSATACTLAGIGIVAFFSAPYIALFCAELGIDLGFIPAASEVAIDERIRDFARASALVRLDEILTTGFNEPAIGWQVLNNTAAAALLFVAAWLLFDVCTRNETAALDGGPQWIARLLRLGRTGSRRAWPRAIVWKDFYYVAGGPRIVLLKLPVYALLLFVVVLFSYSGYSWNYFTMREFGEFTMGCALFVLLLEAALIAARTFRLEQKAHTWPTLMTLPRSIPEVAYPKLAGAALGMLPAGAFFFLGALIAPETIFEFFEEVVFDDEGFFILLYLLTQLALFLHFTALLSVTWNWAAWPVAIFFGGFFVIMGNILLMACIEMGPSVGPTGAAPILLVLSFVAGSLILAVHVWIGVRLASLAAE